MWAGALCFLLFLHLAHSYYFTRNYAEVKSNSNRQATGDDNSDICGLLYIYDRRRIVANQYSSIFEPKH